MNFARLQPNQITGAILRIFTSSQALLELLYVCTYMYKYKCTEQRHLRMDPAQYFVAERPLDK